VLKYRPVIWSYKKVCRVLNLNQELLPVLAGELFYDIQSQAEFCSKGSLFLPHEDSINELVEVYRAFRNGAAAAIISIDRGYFHEKAPVIKVSCRKEALVKLAAAARESFAGAMIAVTGSTGKTTTKDMLHHTLSHLGPCHGTYLNRNVGLDVALAVAQVPATAGFSVIEVSSGWPNCIAEKNIYVKPDIGIITNVGYSHSEYFSGIQDILKEKLSLFDSLTDKRVAILNRSVYDLDKDNLNLIETKNIDRLITVGNKTDDTVRLIDLEQQPTKISARVSIDKEIYSYSINYPAPAFAWNALFSMAAGYALDLDLEVIADSINTFSGLDRRLERLRVDASGSGKIIELIHDAYNASPDSVRALLSILKQRKKAKRRVMIFGDMLEMGDVSSKLHEDLVGDIASSGIDLLITVGQYTKVVAALLSNDLETYSFPDADSARAKIMDLIDYGDLVAVKGSNGMSLDKIVKRLTGKGMYRTPASSNWTIEGELE